MMAIRGLVGSARRRLCGMRSGGIVAGHPSRECTVLGKLHGGVGAKGAEIATANDIHKSLALKQDDNVLMLGMDAAADMELHAANQHI